MQDDQAERAAAAAVACAGALGLDAERASVLQSSNRLVVRLLPCDVVARVAPAEQLPGAAAELELARRLAQDGGPVAAPEPRVAPRAHLRDGHVVTLWAYYAPGPQPVAPEAYARALAALHASMRQLAIATPHFTDRVAEAQRLVASRERTPGLAEADRALLGGALRDLRQRIVGRGAPEQLLHGEPHPGNLLATRQGPLLVDLETCCRGPAEFDLAHAPEEVGARYPGADQALLRECRALVLAMVAAWRWDRDDQFPDGRRAGVELLGQLRAALSGRPAPRGARDADPDR